MEDPIEVMGVNAEPLTPIFMDVLAAANQPKEWQQASDDNDAGNDNDNDDDECDCDGDGDGDGEGDDDDLFFVLGF